MKAKNPPSQQKAGHAAAHHQQRHQRAAAVAEDVTKRKQQELAHGCLLRGSAVADDYLSVGEADDARSVFKQALVVGGEDEGETEAAVQVAHQVDELGGVARVEIGGRLVGQDQARDDGRWRAPRPRAGVRRRRAGRAVVGPGGEADAFEGLGDASAALVGADALNQQRDIRRFRRR